MWGKRQGEDDWDGERRDQPEDRRDQRPDDRRGGGFWDEPGDWARNGAPGPRDRGGFADSSWAEPQSPRRGRPEFGSDPGFGDSRPGDARRPARDFPDAGFGQPGYGGRGGDSWGGDRRDSDRRDGDRRDQGERRDMRRRDGDRRGVDRRDGGPWNDAGDWGQPEPGLPVPVFTPAALQGHALPDAGSSGSSSATSGTRPYGRLEIFTLLEDKVAEFDRLAAQAAEGVRMHEPDTLVYIMHVVPKAPMQRIIYEIYRDHAAFEEHQRQPHIQQFEEGRQSCVIVTNIIDLRLKYAKVAPLQGVTQAGPGQSQARPAGQSPLPPSARHRAPLPAQAAESDGGWGGEQAGGRLPAQDPDWGPERSFDPAERRSQDWGQSQYMGQRYRDN